MQVFRADALESEPSEKYEAEAFAHFEGDRPLDCEVRCRPGGASERGEESDGNEAP